MSEQQQITYMQTRIFRLASETWNMPVQDVVEIFSQYNVLDYIEQCFGIFHVEGDEAVLEDVQDYLRRKGVDINATIK